jgi:hypothetical protein
MKKYEIFFTKVVQNCASLGAKWQAIGFVHGFFLHYYLTFKQFKLILNLFKEF